MVVAISLRKTFIESKFWSLKLGFISTFEKVSINIYVCEQLEDPSKHPMRFMCVLGLQVSKLEFFFLYC